MDNTRKALVWGLLSVVALISIGFFAFASKTEMRSTPYWLGLTVGIGLGTLTALYLNVTWNPANLELRNPKAQTADPRWLPIAIIGGVIASRLIPTFFAPKLQILFDNSLFAWLVITMAYIAIQVWWHRSKRGEL